jgi:large repetitive protein
VIDGVSNAVTAQLNLPGVPFGVDPASDTLYALAGGVEVVNLAKDTVTATIGVPCGPKSFAALDPLTHMVYVTDCENGTVDVVNVSTDAVVAVIPAVVNQSFPITYGVAVNTATNTIYVADAGDNQIVVIDGATNTVTRRIAVVPARSTPIGLAIDPGTGLVYGASYFGGAVTVIDPTTDSVSALATGLAGPYSLALDSGSGTLYASTAFAIPFGVTYVINMASGVIAAQIPRGGNSVAVATSGGSAYVDGSDDAGPIGEDVTVITPSTVNAMSPVMDSQSVTFTVGQAGQGQLTASAIPAATFSSTDLPAWLNLSPSGLLSGTPPAGSAGASTDTVTAANGIAPAYSEGLLVVVDEAPAFTSADQVTFQEGAFGSFGVTSIGYPVPTVSESGALPPGVTFSGVLQGTPAAGTAGSYPITFTATNSSGTARQDFTLKVTPTAPIPAIGLEGSDGALWVLAPQLNPGWHSLGGVISAPPAVAAPPNPNGIMPADPLFIATGTDGTLWIRSATAGWQPVGAARCIGGPAAVITGSTLTLACRGTDNALWYNTTTPPSSGLPTFPATGWASLGGVLSAGPAIAPVGSTVTFFVRGTSGAIYTRTVAAGYAVTPWSCAGQPAAAQQAATGTTTFACNAGGALWQSDNSGSGWSPAVSLGGSLVGGPAIAAASLETDFLAEGTDHAIWERTPVGWTSFGGSAVGGVGAAALN